MRKLVIILLTSIISIGTYAQQVDTKAKAILDKLSAKTKAYKTVKAEFQYMITNKTEGINESQTGKIEIKGNKYNLAIQGQNIISDGKYMYTVLKESEEVQISNLPDEADEDNISPNKIFTLYETGFKYKFVKEENNVQVISLFPKKPEEKSFHRIVLYINKTKNQINKVKIFGKDGSNFTYKIKTFSPNATISDSEFKFDKTKYPNFEVIDLRD